jgi:signal transduction histidine kinase
MLIELIAAHRDELIARTREMVAMRLAPRPTEGELMSGVPLFLDQLAETLRFAGPAASEAMGRSATMRGAAMMGHGYSVAQVVRDYGDICQAVTELATELDAPITAGEFHTLNLCLDKGIAEAVTEYVRLRDESRAAGEVERSGVLAHELRNRVSAAQMGFQAIRSGRAPANGSVAAIVTRSLRGLASLINRSLVEIRVDSGITRSLRVEVSDLLQDVSVEGQLEANLHGVSFSVAPMGHGAQVSADREVLAGALANLLQNAFKFTRSGGLVTLEARVVGTRVEIDVADECGGLPPGKIGELFEAFRQHGSNRTGLGLGLFISRKGIDACGGAIRVKDRPGTGCVFTIDLPLALSSPSQSGEMGVQSGRVAG